MKRFLVLLAVLVAAVSFALSMAGKVSAAKQGTIILKDDRHVVKFKRDKGGFLRGEFVDEVTKESRQVKRRDVDRVIYNSVRMGWFGNSRAQEPFDEFKRRRKIFRGVIEGTANNDIGNWSLLLQDGSFVWFIPGNWKYKGIPALAVDGTVEYGVFRDPRIIFSRESPATAGIFFNANVLSGLERLVDPDQVILVQWNSDKVGWDGGVEAPLEKDESGNYLAILKGMPDRDKGNFNLLLPGSVKVWFLVDAWEFGGTAVVNVDLATFQIEYSFP